MEKIIPVTDLRSDDALPELFEAVNVLNPVHFRSDRRIGIAESFPPLHQMKTPGFFGTSFHASLVTSTPEKRLIGCRFLDRVNSLQEVKCQFRGIPQPAQQKRGGREFC